MRPDFGEGSLILGEVVAAGRCVLSGGEKSDSGLCREAERRLLLCSVPGTLIREMVAQAGNPRPEQYSVTLMRWLETR